MSNENAPQASDERLHLSGRTTFVDLGQQVYDRLENPPLQLDFDDFTLDVPRDTGEDTPHATWKFDGSVYISRD